MALDRAPWLVRAKASPPTLPAHCAQRSRLLTRLAASQHPPVVALHAAAGFGKTTLLCQWRQSLIEAGTIVGWLSLDESDDPATLIPYLALAMAEAGVDVSNTGLLNPRYQGARLDRWLDRLIATMEAEGRAMVLVLDDLERCSHESATSVIDSLLRKRPTNLRVCLAMRHNPGIALSGFAVAGALLSIGVDELRFTREELEDWYAGEATADQCDAALEQTGGWPVALRLHTGAINGGTAATLATGTNLDAYLREQLVSRLKPELSDFLAAVSILELVAAPCANYLRAADDSGSRLRELHERMGGLVLPVEGSDDTYRVHPLVRTALRLQLQEDDADRFRTLSRRAATWFQQNGRELEGMRYALNADDPSLAAEIFESMGAVQLFVREGMTRFSKALALLEGHKLEAYPRVQIARATAAAKRGRAREAQKYMDRATTGMQDRPFDLVTVDANIADLIVREYGCRPTPIPFNGPEWVQTIAAVREAPELLGMIYTVRCVYALQSGNLESGFKFGREAIAEFARAESQYGELFIYLHFGMGEMARGRLDAAGSEFLRALKMTRAEFGGDAGLKQISDILFAELYWEKGDAAAASTYANRVGRRVRQPEAWFDLHMAAYQTVAEWRCHQGRSDDALAFLDQAYDYAVTEGLDRLANFVLQIRYLTLVSVDQRDEAAALAQRYSLAEEPTSRHLTWREIEAIGRCQANIARVERDAKSAKDIARRMIDYGAQLGLARVQIHGLIELARAECLQTQHNSASQKALVDALTLAAPTRYLRPFLRAAAELAEPLRELSEHQGGSEVESLRSHLLAMLSLPDEAAGGGEMTARENEILQHLLRGKPDKLIARETGLSAHGVRYHLKKIYAKLGVNNRTQAANRARERGISKFA